MALGSERIQHNAAQVCKNAACSDAVGDHVDAWQARPFACHLILSSLELDFAELAACLADALKQKKQEACLLAEAPSLLLPAGLMHLETTGDGQAVLRHASACHKLDLMHRL